MRTISQRELRNDSGEIMRALERGESFTVTRRGTPVGLLVPAGTTDLQSVTLRVGTGAMEFPEGIHRKESSVDLLRELRGDR